MLDNLVNADLSGLTGHIYYSYDSMSQVIPSLFIAMGVLIFFIVLAVGIMSLVNGTKTKRYREQLVDMYVSASIRKFAKDDGLDLSEEYKTFVTESKKANLKYNGLSKVVEEELAERVVEEQEEKINKNKK